MRRLINRQNPAALEKDFPSADAGRDKTFVKRLVWLYFWLLLAEGALRKWFLPGLSNPLLIVRDPIVLLIYWQASSLRLWPRLPLLSALGPLVMISVGWAMFQMMAGIVTAPEVLLFGLRSDFLHLPLVFVLPRIFDAEDIKRMGFWALVVAIPMALLVVHQFRSSPDAWINVGVGGGKQLLTAAGKVRPAGTFSFIAGTVAFFAFASAFWLHGLAKRETFAKWLLIAGLPSIGLALACSGSRSAVLSSAIVAATYLIAIMAARQAAAGITRFLFLAILAALVLNPVEHFEEGTEVLAQRFAAAAATEAEQGGLVGRFLDQMTGPIKHLPNVPLLGHGLGVGTNVGAKLVTGEVMFLLSEGEWGRIIMEMGPFLGLAFIVYRIWLVIWLGQIAYRRAKEGEPLALLLFSATAINILLGQWGQPTILGFAALTGGLCLAAAEQLGARETAPLSAKGGRKPIRRSERPPKIAGP